MVAYKNYNYKKPYKKTYAKKRKGNSYYSSRKSTMSVLPSTRFKRRNPKVARRSNKVSIVLQNNEIDQSYQSVHTSHTGQLYTSFNNGSGGVYGLPDYLSTIGAYQKYIDNFRYVRCRGIRITLIPQKWNATTLTTATAAPELQNGEKPRIHFIHDVGQTYAWKGTGTLSIGEGESFGKQCKEGQFIKTYKFWIKPLAKLADNAGVGAGGTQSWQGYSSWVSTNGFGVHNRLCPQYNLYFGFSNAPTEFTYKTVIEWYLEFKDLYYEPPPLQALSDMTIQEEKDAEVLTN